MNYTGILLLQISKHTLMWPKPKSLCSGWWMVGVFFRPDCRFGDMASHAKSEWTVFLFTGSITLSNLVTYPVLGERQTPTKTNISLTLRGVTSGNPNCQSNLRWWQLAIPPEAPLVGVSLLGWCNMYFQHRNLKFKSTIHLFDLLKSNPRPL